MAAGASGGRHSDENASVRLMWRTDLMAEAYVYATAAADSPEYKTLESCHFNPACVVVHCKLSWPHLCILLHFFLCL